MTIQDNGAAPSGDDSTLDPGAGGVIDTGHPDGDGTLQNGQAATITDADAVSAFRTGAAEVSNPDLVKPPETAKSAADVAAEAAEAADAAKAKDDKTAVPPAAAPAAAAVDEKKKPEIDPAVTAEVKMLGLKGRAADRFHEMSAQLKEANAYQPVREVLEKVGVKTVEEAQTMLDAAARGVQWEDAVLSSTATPEQFGGAMTVIKCMNSNDPKMLNVAFDSMYGELTNLGKRLGRELPGSVDPLDAHPDLKQAVADEEITPKFAMEQARLRANAKLTDQQQQQQSTQTQQQQEVQNGMQSLDNLSAQLMRSDPMYGAKLEIITPQLIEMRKTLHPSRWAERAATLYATVVLPAAAPAPAPVAAPPRRVPVTNVPLRTGVASTAVQKQPTNDLDAFKQGVAGLNASG